MTGRERDQLIQYIDEGVRLEDKLAALKQEIADFYAIAGEHMKIKPAHLKKLVKFYREGDTPSDPELVRLREELEKTSTE